MSTSSMPYISQHNDAGWLVRVPVAYFYDGESRTLRYKQKLFTYNKCGGAEKSLAMAIAFRESNRLKCLTYNDRGPMAHNGRQTSHKQRVRGADLPVGITDTVQHSRQGNEQYSITVQAMHNKKSRTKSYSYGHSRTRDEAIALAKLKLAEFLTTIDQTISKNHIAKK